MHTDHTGLQHALAGARLQVLGGFRVNANDRLPVQSGSLLLIGPDEPAFWPYFTTSPEYTDGQADPLDRWSRRTLDAIAATAGAVALYPFGGPPYQPFYQWALRSRRAWASPVGFLVHDRTGLFVSYRGALVVPWVVETNPGICPCDTCAEKPCQTTCPVGALTKDGYAVPTCKSYLRTSAGHTCMTMGCAVRRACPIGQDLRISAQSAFHMDAFL